MTDVPGRTARTPIEIPPQGWKQVLWRVWHEIGDDNANIVAAGVALFALLAVFPALIAIVSLYGLVASPQDIAAHVEAVRGVMPAAAADLMVAQIESLTQQKQSSKGLGILVGVLFALWSARRGIAAIMVAIDIAYDADNQRGFFKQLLLSLLFTAGAVLTVVVVLILAVMLPVAFRFLGEGPLMENLVMMLRWVVLWLLVAGGLAVLYRWAPDREPARWRWITPGSAIAATLWLLISLLFSLYVRNFGNFNETYGTLGGVMITVLWFHLSAFVIVLGAELNSEMEHQTDVDTTC